MLRGSSRLATRSRRKRVILREIDRSSFANSRSASPAKLIDQAMAFHDFLERDGAISAGANISHSLLGDIEVLKVIEVFENRLAGVVGLRPACGFGQRVQSLFNLFGKTNGEHYALQCRYT